MEQIFATQTYRDIVTPFLAYKDCARLRSVSKSFHVYFETFALHSLIFDHFGVRSFEKRLEMGNRAGAGSRKPSPNSEDVLRSITKLSSLKINPFYDISRLKGLRPLENVLEFSRQMLDRLPDTISELVLTRVLYREIRIGDLFLPSSKSLFPIQRFTRLKSLEISFCDCTPPTSELIDIYSSIAPLNLQRLKLNHFHHSLDLTQFPMNSLQILEISQISSLLDSPQSENFRADITGFPNLTSLSLSYDRSYRGMRHQPIVIGSAKVETFSGLYLPTNEQLRKQIKIWQVGYNTLRKAWLYDVNEMPNLQEIQFEYGFDSCESVRMYMNDMFERATPMLRAFAQNGGILSQVPLMGKYRKVSRLKLNRWEVSLECQREEISYDYFDPEGWTLVLRSIIDQPVEYLHNGVVYCSEMKSP